MNLSAAILLVVVLTMGVAEARSGKKRSMSSSSSSESSSSEDVDTFCQPGVRPDRRGRRAAAIHRSRRRGFVARRGLRGDDDDSGDGDDDDSRSSDDGDDDDSRSSDDGDDDSSSEDSLTSGEVVSFESSFFISYANRDPDVTLESFDSDDLSSINFLQDSIGFVFNGEIGCSSDEGPQFDVTRIVLESQTTAAEAMAAGGGRQLQAAFGMGFGLINFYRVFGNCKFCGPNSLLTNDATRRLKEVFPSHRQLEDGMPDVTANFNREIITQLNRRDVFAGLGEASVTNDMPVFVPAERDGDAEGGGETASDETGEQAVDPNSNDFMDDLDVDREDVPPS